MGFTTCHNICITTIYKNHIGLCYHKSQYFSTCTYKKHTGLFCHKPQYIYYLYIDVSYWFLLPHVSVPPCTNPIGLFLLPQVTVYAPHQHTEAVLVFVTICPSSMCKMLLVFVTCQIMCTISSYKNCISLCCDMSQYVHHLNIQKLVGLCCHISQYVHHLNIQKLVWSLLPHITVCTPPQHATAGLVFVVTYHCMCTTSTYKSWFGLCCHISQCAHHLNMQQLVWSLLSHITVCGSSQHIKAGLVFVVTYHCMCTISAYKSWFGLCYHISQYAHHLNMQQLVWSLLSHITVCGSSQYTKTGLVFVSHISQYVDHLNI